jgi:hypothetical protein
MVQNHFPIGLCTKGNEEPLDCPLRSRLFQSGCEFDTPRGSRQSRRTLRIRRFSAREAGHTPRAKRSPATLSHIGPWRGARHSVTLVVVVATSVPPESVRIGPAPIGHIIDQSLATAGWKSVRGERRNQRRTRWALDFRRVDPPVLVQVEAHTEDGRGGFLNLELG